MVPGKITVQQLTCHFPVFCTTRFGGSGGRETAGEEILLQ
jgi:hypothetical protein